uniref:Major facilitator superfamily (MFS) profile domain-containing protein n=1 Tax=Meloidogyne floridensis TaxID=298350 RepID=A0A915NQ02_9BILA
MSISSTKNNEKENIKISSPIIINNGDSSSFSTEKFQRTTSDKNKKMEGHWTKSLIFAVLAAAFGSSFQFGYHIGCINLPADLIKQWFSEQISGSDAATIETRWGMAVGVFAVGGMIGGNLVGIVATKLGRKRALLYNNALAIIAGALMAGAKFVGNYWLFILGRLIVGINAGLNSGLAPMYLTEVSPANLRGATGSFAQLFVQAELDLICEEAAKANSGAPSSMKDIYGTRLPWPLVLALFMMISQQLSGINAGGQCFIRLLFSREPVLKDNVRDFKNFLLTDRFKLLFKGPNYATIAMGAINVLMTVVSVYLVEHPRFGRRTLHITGMVGMCFSTAMIAISMLVAKSIEFVSFLSIIFVLLFVISFATGPGSIPWFYVNEMFPSNLRGIASTFAVTVNWICVILVATFFPIIDVRNSGGIFLLCFHCSVANIYSVCTQVFA